MNETIKALSRQYGQSSETVKVDIPEADTSVRFRTRLTVADVEVLGEEKPSTPLLMRLCLFRMLAVDDRGERLIQGEDAEDFFQSGCDAMVLSNAVEKAGLVEKVFGQLEDDAVPKGDGEGKP